MVKSILGTKVGMTQVFDDTGAAVPVTVVLAGPCVVVQKKTIEKDGYEAVQIAYGEIKDKRVNRPKKGHFAKYEVKPRRHLREVRMPGVEDMKPGDEINVSVFEPGDNVDVTATSKGKGFAGVMKRYGWRGGKASHGSGVHRKPQSAGATDPAHVFKGQGMPGRMGNCRVTVKRLPVFSVDEERNVLLIRGSVPGPNGGLLIIREAK